MAALYVSIQFPHYIQLDHLYVHPEFQGKQIGSRILEKVIAAGKRADLPVKLSALVGSRSNEFYRRHGFVQIGESEFDIHYEI